MGREEGETGKDRAWGRGAGYVWSRGVLPAPHSDATNRPPPPRAPPRTRRAQATHTPYPLIGSSCRSSGARAGVGDTRGDTDQVGRRRRRRGQPIVPSVLQWMPLHSTPLLAAVANSCTPNHPRLRHPCDTPAPVTRNFFNPLEARRVKGHGRTKHQLRNAMRSRGASRGTRRQHATTHRLHWKRRGCVGGMKWCRVGGGGRQ